MRRRLAGFGALALASGISCGGNSGVASCTISQMAGTLGTTKICEEVAGADGPLRETCMRPDAGATGITVSSEFAAAPCSRDGAVGGCRISQPSFTITDWWYATGSSGDPTPEKVQQLCTGIGTFVAP